MGQNGLILESFWGILEQKQNKFHECQTLKIQLDSWKHKYDNKTYSSKEAFEKTEGLFSWSEVEIFAQREAKGGVEE